MKTIDTRQYVQTLRELTEQGKEVSMVVAGGSMSPFLVHQRDVICFRRPDGQPKRGDMVFYQRRNGQFVMHRIWRVEKDGYYLVGDAQTDIEGPIHRNQIFGQVIRVKRKDRWIESGDFWWDFFQNIWIRMVPLRPLALKLHSLLKRQDRMDLPESIDPDVDQDSDRNG
ncbi:MAG: S24/S26 family peptidase [Hominisplanchenecus sp.]